MIPTPRLRSMPMTLNRVSTSRSVKDAMGSSIVFPSVGATDMAAHLLDRMFPNVASR